MGLLNTLKRALGRPSLPPHPEARAALVALILPQVPVGPLLEVARGGVSLSQARGSLVDRAWRERLVSLFFDERLEALVYAWLQEGGRELDAWRLIEVMRGPSAWREELVKAHLSSAWVQKGLSSYGADSAYQSILHAPLLYMPSAQELELSEGERGGQSPLSLRARALSCYVSGDLERFAELAAQLSQRAPVTGALMELVASWVSSMAEESEASSAQLRSAALSSMRRLVARDPYNLFMRHLALELERFVEGAGGAQAHDLNELGDPDGIWERVATAELKELRSGTLDSLNPSDSADEELSAEPELPITAGASREAEIELELELEPKLEPKLEPELESELELEAQLEPEQSDQASAEPAEAELDPPSAQPLEPIQTLLPEELIEQEELSTAHRAPTRADLPELMQRVELSEPIAQLEPVYEARELSSQLLSPLVKLMYGQQERFVCLNKVTRLNPDPHYSLPTGPITVTQLEAWLDRYGAPLSRRMTVRLLSLAGLRLPDEWEARAFGESAFVSGAGWTRSHLQMMWSFGHGEWISPREPLRVLACAIDVEQIDPERSYTQINASEVLASSAELLLERLLSPALEAELEESAPLEAAEEPPPFEAAEEPPPLEAAEEPPPFEAVEEPPPFEAAEEPPPFEAAEEPPPFEVVEALNEPEQAEELGLGLGLEDEDQALEAESPVLHAELEAQTAPPQELRPVEGELDLEVPHEDELGFEGGFEGAFEAGWTSPEMSVDELQAALNDETTPPAAQRDEPVASDEPFQLEGDFEAELETEGFDELSAALAELSVESGALDEDTLKPLSVPAELDQIERGWEDWSELEEGGAAGALDDESAPDAELDLSQELDSALQTGDFGLAFDHALNALSTGDVLLEDEGNDGITIPPDEYASPISDELTELVVEPAIEPAVQPSLEPSFEPSFESPSELMDPSGERQLLDPEPIEGGWPLSHPEEDISSSLIEPEAEGADLSLPADPTPSLPALFTAEVNTLAASSREDLPHVEPTQAFEEPPQAFEEPPQAFEEPPQAFEEPTQAFEEPTQAFEEPPQAFEEPPQAFEEPPQAHRTPLAPDARPSTTQSPVFTTDPAFFAPIGSSAELPLSESPTPSNTPDQSAPIGGLTESTEWTQGEVEIEEPEDYQEFDELMAALPNESARELFELLADGSEQHVSQIASQIGGTALSVSLLRNAVNRTFDQVGSDLYVHSEFRPKQGERPLGIYYYLTRSS